MSKLEKQVRDSCLSRAKKSGVQHKRMHFGHGAAAGWPDDFFYFGLRDAVWVEFKAEGKEASPLQREVHGHMRDHGQHVYVVDSVAQFEQILLDHFH